MELLPWNRVLVDLAALRHNFHQLRARVGPAVRIMAVVKANAYGHGLVPVARTLAGAGATTFGVAEVEEGIRLRQAGIEGEIVVLLGVERAAIQELVRHGLSPVVFSREQLPWLSKAALAAGRVVGVHLKVDLGMGRLGISPDEVIDFAGTIAGLPGLSLAGMMSHLPLADQPGDQSLEQHQRFQALVARLAALAMPTGTVHLANSAALFRDPRFHAGMVRPGIALYGCPPAAGPLFNDLGLRSVMAFHSRVLQVKDVPAGQGISYGHRYVTTRPTRLAVLPVGYDDGFLRCLSGRAQVLLHGRRAPVRGTICMNACMVEVGHIPGVQPGDEVVLLGGQQEERITAQEIAGWMESIAYEVLCLLGSRNRHFYRDQDQESFDRRP